MSNKYYLSDHLDSIKSEIINKNWSKAKQIADSALKKISLTPFPPKKEYLLYLMIGDIYYGLVNHAKSLEHFYKASLVAHRNRLPPVCSAYASFKMGILLLEMRNIGSALRQLQKVEQYYREYGSNAFPLDNEKHIITLIGLGYCSLYAKDYDNTRIIIEEKISPYLTSLNNRLLYVDYIHFKGEFLLKTKRHEEAYKLFQECVKICEQINSPRSSMEAKIHLANIDIMENNLDQATRTLQFVLKDARQLKFNDLICEASIFLGKCYAVKQMPQKAATIERLIKPNLAKLDPVWLYEKNREFEEVFNQKQINTNKSQPYDVKKPFNILARAHIGSKAYSGQVVIGDSLLMQEVYQLVAKIAVTDLPILIQGETGTGKELIAHMIHEKSLRVGYPCLAFNCGAIPETLIESGLFGHTKGAFTGAIEDTKGYIELADKGTLFIDEISNMSPSMQQKLLRVLEEKFVWRVGASKPIAVNTRFVFASNRDIEQMVRQKLFREDLLYRINTIVVNLPPLRNRKEDISLLTQHFLRKCLLPRQVLPEVSSGALALLSAYPWPGNVRELENEIKKICVLFPDAKIITASILSEPIQNYKNPYHKDGEGSNHSLKVMTDNFQRNIVEETLRKFNGNITQTARYLGYERRYLYKKMMQLGIGVSGKFREPN
jgi:transcriptional regulator with PAS, ATPase and Fis domain